MPRVSPKRKLVTVTHDGRDYPLTLENLGWRLRSRSKSHPVDFRTGTSNATEAKKRAKRWLEERADDPIVSRKGGGNLAALVDVYLKTPKRTQQKNAIGNISRLRTICRMVLGKELEDVTCREVSPELWQRYQRLALEKAGHKFDLTTRYRENVAINAAVRVARCLFLPALLRAYRASHLDVRPDAGLAVMLPEPFVPKTKADDAQLIESWAGLRETDLPLWLVVGLARFAGLRQKEIAAARLGWIEVKGAVVHIVMRDRPEEKWWTKTGKPYRAQVIDPTLAEWLAAAQATCPPDQLIVPDPSGEDRIRWIQRAPQAWIRTQEIDARAPLHRLRGLYADHIAKLTADAVAIRMAAVKAAQENLGHTTSATTEKHYLS